MRTIDFLDYGLQLRPAAPCVIDSHGVHSHEQIRHLSHRVANGLYQAGLRRGSCVAVYGANSALAFAAMIGLLRAGGVWLPIAARNPMHEKIEFLAENNCEFIFYDAALTDDVGRMRAALPQLKGLVCLDSTQEKAPAFVDWVTPYSNRFPDDGHGPEDLAWIKGTGGTTGRPKSVMICHRNVEAVFSTFQMCLPMDTPHINLVAAPLTHGAGNIALAILFGGGTNVMIERADPLAILDAIEAQRITTMFLPPTVIYDLLAAPGVRDRDYSSLRYFIYAAAPMSTQKLAEAIDVFGPVMTQTWGQTEAPLICTYLAPHEHFADDSSVLAHRLRSCGRASPLTRVEIMDDDGKLLDVGEIGELVVRGNLVMRGYLARPEENAAVTRFGWHHTGDVGYRDEEGYFYIVDRKKDMIISGGFNIYPSEIEQVLWKHPSVLDCAVIGVPDSHWGEAVKAVVELKTGFHTSEQELKDHCRAVLGGMKTPKSVEIWPNLPRSAVGKVLKKDIREPYWKGLERRV
jgi:acyl-CoA synthetase (AMP-forming)/AMP-acid ligase II